MNSLLTQIEQLSVVAQNRLQDIEETYLRGSQKKALQTKIIYLKSQLHDATHIVQRRQGLQDFLKNNKIKKFQRLVK